MGAVICMCIPAAVEDFLFHAFLTIVINEILHGEMHNLCLVLMFAACRFESLREASYGSYNSTASSCSKVQR